MPPTSPRTIGSEDSLARRVQYEREKRGWSPASLAERMTKAGCPMTQSAIWKIENGEPRRRITVDELVAFSNVFELPIEDWSTIPGLLTDPEIAANKEAIDLMNHIGRLADEFDRIARALTNAWNELAGVIGKVTVSKMREAQVRYPNAFTEQYSRRTQQLSESTSPTELSEAIKQWIDDIGERENQAWRRERSYGIDPEDGA